MVTVKQRVGSPPGKCQGQIDTDYHNVLLTRPRSYMQQTQGNSDLCPDIHLRAVPDYMCTFYVQLLTAISKKHRTLTHACCKEGYWNECHCRDTVYEPLRENKPWNSLIYCRSRNTHMNTLAGLHVLLDTKELQENLNLLITVCSNCGVVKALLNRRFATAGLQDTRLALSKPCEIYIRYLFCLNCLFQSTSCQ